MSSELIFYQILFVVIASGMLSGHLLLSRRKLKKSLNQLDLTKLPGDTSRLAQPLLGNPYIAGTLFGKPFEVRFKRHRGSSETLEGLEIRCRLEAKATQQFRWQSKEKKEVSEVVDFLETVISADNVVEHAEKYIPFLATIGFGAGQYGLASGNNNGLSLRWQVTGITLPESSVIDDVALALAFLWDCSTDSRSLSA